MASPFHSPHYLCCGPTTFLIAILTCSLAIGNIDAFSFSRGPVELPFVNTQSHIIRFHRLTTSVNLSDNNYDPNSPAYSNDDYNDNAVNPIPVTNFQAENYEAGWGMGERQYQLEEREDTETATTDIILNADSTIALGKTDGPFFLDAFGNWQVWEEASETTPKTFFSMKVTRRYLAGEEESEEASKGTYIGEFGYTVERTFTGEVTLVGGSAFAVNGEIHDVDEIFGDREVGYFNMIDAMEAR